LKSPGAPLAREPSIITLCDLLLAFMPHDFTLSPLGDNALLISFGNNIDEACNQRVLQLYHRLKDAFPFILDLVPAYSSLAVYYDVLYLRQNGTSAYEKIKTFLLPLLHQPQSEISNKESVIFIPVCYSTSFAPDLEMLAAQKNISVNEVIRLHTAGTYRVYTIGFLPGFPYMGKVDERIAMPRRTSPRTAVPAGSVGIAGEQTGIYPITSPGGWNIIGQTPLKLFDASRKDPVLLQPGDKVRFYAITQNEFENYQDRIA
jgi:inhibitor of KinA